MSQIVQSLDFTDITKKLRKFFDKKGWVEVHSQDILRLLSVCEETNTVSNLNYDGMIWPLPQTAQICLEHELSKHPDWKGVFCLSTSFKNTYYRENVNKILPMFEFIVRGDMNQLIDLEAELLEYLGFGEIHKYMHTKYNNLTEKYNTDKLNNEHSQLICNDFGSIVFLEDYPNNITTFWNTKLSENKLTSKKVNVIIDGLEVIHSAEMSINKEEMRDQFYKMNNRNYSNSLFANYGKERVEQELEEYLNLDFSTRAGGYIDINKFIDTMKLNNLLYKPLQSDIRQKILEKENLEKLETLEKELINTKRRCWGFSLSSKKKNIVNTVTRVASKAGAKAFEIAGEVFI